MRTYLLALLTLVALLTNAAAVAQNRTPDAQMLSPLAQVQAALDRRDWGGAETLLNELLKAEPKNAIANFQLAQLYENTSRIEASKNIYRAIAAIPEAEKAKYGVTTIKDNKEYLVFLPDLAQEKFKKLSASSQPNVGDTSAAPSAVVAPASATSNASSEFVKSPSSVESAPQVIAMRQWVAAWQSKQLEAYFASYLPDYKGNKVSPAAWQKSRTKRINSKSKIAINAYDVSVIPIDSQQVQVKFTQAYVAPTLGSLTHKTLLMANSNGRWLIAKETAK